MENLIKTKTEEVKKKIANGKFSVADCKIITESFKKLL